ncbi:MAG: rhomboid family intramembrane serine protease [Candidatus Rokubacteria bacterium]|nr:rhomboid family intramembrane serine protease [Candidatus Rokubacteria bacterium]
MFPLKDDIPTRTTPIITVALIALNILVFLYQLSLQGEGSPDGLRASRDFILEFGLVPCRLTGACSPGSWLLPPTLTVLTSMFLHGGFLHVGGNMLYLWIFGNNVEDTLGHARFTLFYLVSGAVAAAAQTALSAASSVPMIGASGAVSGVLGAYLLLFPRANVLTLIVLGFFVRIVRVPAILVLGLWFVVQFVSGLATWGAATGRGEAMGGETAWFAHLGGFLAGMVLLFVLRPRNPGDGGPGRSW